ncbi:CaiB/BaiF CoA transferase family protein [Oceanibaculum nanhaiense]|uniref:CaiB/BaiF CoA transferase family protein n=1 Tax=Oceanibaculum nanhaiense TaxID=1909734 RepID=UPI003D2DFCAE
MADTDRKGPLAGLRIVEFAGIGPAPFCAMLLADMGAEVVRLDRLEPSGLGIPKPARFELMNRGRRSVAIDLKQPEGVACALDLIARADALIEGFRPGTMERLGLGPDVCLARNSKLVYGRLTGWGQDGPLAHSAGHDMNYIALAGMLAGIGREGAPPTPPLNLVGDFGGGGMLLAFGLVCALLEAQRSGKGQVVDAAMVDGAALLGTMFFGLRAAGIHREERGRNLLDSGAPHYEVYECADGKYVAVAPIEAKFRRELLQRIGFDPAAFPDVEDSANWPAAKQLLAVRFREKSRADWCALLEGTDSCFAPVLDLDEAPEHPHNQARDAFPIIGGIAQPAPAPRFSRTAPALPAAPVAAGADSRAVLEGWGLDAARIETLFACGAVGSPDEQSR